MTNAPCREVAFGEDDTAPVAQHTGIGVHGVRAR